MPISSSLIDVAAYIKNPLAVEWECLLFTRTLSLSLQYYSQCSKQTKVANLETFQHMNEKSYVFFQLFDKKMKLLKTKGLLTL